MVEVGMLGTRLAFKAIRAARPKLWAAATEALGNQGEVELATVLAKLNERGEGNCGR